MNISGTAGQAPSNTDRKSGSFAESLRKEGPASTIPQVATASMKSFASGDLASNFSYVSPDFTPAHGEEMLDAIAIAEGANAEMQRFEKKVEGR